MVAFSVSHDDVQFLRTVHGTDRPFGVFRAKLKYLVKVLRKIHLGCFHTEHAAAVEVVKWYRERYGDDWRHVLASRHVNPIRYERRRRGCGYEVTVWVHGQPVKVTERCGGQLVNYYPTIEMAKRAVSRWIRREFGIFSTVAPIFLYRLSAKFQANPR
jgi:hypothetical protein